MTRLSIARATHAAILVAAAALSGTPARPAAAVERALEKQVVVDAPIDRVWEAWTTRDGIVGFFAPDAEIDARVDGAFHIFFNPDGAPGTRGADTARFLALQPKSMLSFDWIAPPSLPTVRPQRTVVIVRFEALREPPGDRTRVVLHHVGWGASDGVDGVAWDAAYRYFDGAWDGVLGSLQKRFAAGGKPVDWTEFLQRMRAAGAPRTP